VQYVVKEAIVVTHLTTMTRKGQITIPIDERRALGLREGDQLNVERDGDTLLVRRAGSVAARTAGALAAYRKDPPLSIEEERAAFEQAVADEGASSEAR
jgi:AbrB family looped-hinge helix DNA binding protein